MTEELTEILGLTHSGTVRAIDRLVGGGFAERRIHARDRRAIGLHPTNAGTNLIKEMQDGIYAALCAMLDGLGVGNATPLHQQSIFSSRVWSVIVAPRIASAACVRTEMPARDLPCRAIRTHLTCCRGLSKKALQLSSYLILERTF